MKAGKTLKIGWMLEKPVAENALKRRKIEL